MAILQLWETEDEVREVARRLCAARSSVYRWRAEFEEFGEAGIAPQPRGRMDWKATDELLEHLQELVHTSPQELGYLRSRWSSELLALELNQRTGTEVHATTVRRWLRRLGFGYRRARPTLGKRDLRKSQRLQAIAQALADEDPQTEVFYSDEADIDLNPRIGPAWMPRGAQTAIPTPGKNQKRYLAGALNARTGRVVWVEHERKDSCLFIHLLYTLKRAYRRARALALVDQSLAFVELGVGELDNPFLLLSAQVDVTKPEGVRISAGTEVQSDERTSDSAFHRVPSRFDRVISSMRHIAQRARARFLAQA
ncbi:MAG: IS630 family transposase [Gammaproteobacteria bacterium]|nr:IS630 family transposase [Gammaproteobacteria bacterium]